VRRAVAQRDARRGRRATFTGASGAGQRSQLLHHFPLQPLHDSLLLVRTFFIFKTLLWQSP